MLHGQKHQIVITMLNVARSFPLSVTVPQHIPWTHMIHLSHLGNSLKILFGGQKAPAFIVIH